MLLYGEDAKDQEDNGQDDEQDTENAQEARSTSDALHAFIHHFFSNFTKLLVESWESCVGSQVVGKSKIGPA